MCENTCEYGTVYIFSTGSEYINFSLTTFEDNKGANAAALKAKT